MPRFKHGSEDSEQAAFVQWLRLKKIPFFHPRNGGYIGVRQGAKFKALGVVAGIPDICIYAPIEPYHGLFIELKRKGGTISQIQKVRLRELNSLGYFAIVAFGCLEAIEITETYLKAHHCINLDYPRGKYYFV